MTVRIPEPCHVPWSTMDPAEGGRHCQVCDQVVADLSEVPVEELPARLGRRTRCVRVAAAVVGLGLMTGCVKGKAIRHPYTPEPTPTSEAPEEPVEPDDDGT